MILLVVFDCLTVSKLYKYGCCYFSSILGLVCFLSNREDEVSMCHFKKIDFCLFDFCCIGGPSMGLKWIPNDLKMIPKWPPPFPSPASAKVSCQGASRLRKNHCWWFSIIWIKKVERKNDEPVTKLVRLCGPQQYIKSIIYI